MDNLILMSRSDHNSDFALIIWKLFQVKKLADLELPKRMVAIVSCIQMKTFISTHPDLHLIIYLMCKLFLTISFMKSFEIWIMKDYRKKICFSSSQLLTRLAKIFKSSFGHMSFLNGQDRTPKFAGRVLPDRTKSRLTFLNILHTK